MQRSEKSALLWVLISLALAFFSLTLFPASIHTYCQNRKVAAALGAVELVLGTWLLLRKKIFPAERTLSWIAAIFCAFGVLLSIGFIVYFTRMCRQA